MPCGKHKSRTLRRIFVKTPGNRITMHYRKRKPSKAKCGNCGRVLLGVPHVRPFQLQNMAKTEKRPERPYGGVLCSKCLRVLMKEKAASINKSIEGNVSPEVDEK